MKKKSTSFEIDSQVINKITSNNFSKKALLRESINESTKLYLLICNLHYILNKQQTLWNTAYFIGSVWAIQQVAHIRVLKKGSIVYKTIPLREHRQKNQLIKLLHNAALWICECRMVADEAFVSVISWLTLGFIGRFNLVQENIHITDEYAFEWTRWFYG